MAFTAKIDIKIVTVDATFELGLDDKGCSAF